jgi:hypothetical protein
MSDWQVLPGEDVTEGRYDPGLWTKEAWKLVRFVATGSGDNRALPTTRLPPSRRPFSVDITMKSDAAMRLVA